MNNKPADIESLIYKDIDKGSSLKIIFLSGLGLEIRRQREGFLRRFALTHNVSYLALDYTNYIMQESDYSEEKIKSAFLKTMEVLNQQQEKLILVGGCFGGLMALKVAEKKPDNVAGVILFSPPYETQNFPLVDTAESLLQKRIDFLKRRKTDVQILHKLILFKEMIITAFRMHSRETIQPTYQGHLSIFHGQKDNLIPAENSHHIKHTLNNAHCHVHIIKKTGHSLNSDFEMKGPLRVLKTYLSKIRL